MGQSVSRADFERWTLEQRTLIAEYSSKFDQRVTELERENNALKAINRSLESRLIDSERISISVDKSDQNVGTSAVVIDKFVEELLSDPTININYFPDAVERQIYRNVFHLLVKLIDKTVSQSSVNLLGHEITFQMRPQSFELKI